MMIKSSKKQAHDASKHTRENTDISIGMRVMKVGITRPWFNGNLLRESQEFWHTNSVPINSGSPSKIKAALASADSTVLEKANSTSMPSWTTGFVVAKDVHVLFKSDQQFTSEHVSNIRKSSSSGGGFLCFSCSKSESSLDHRTEAQTLATANTLSIRIPAPQILAWISELCPEGKCQANYTPLPTNEIKLHPPRDVKDAANVSEAGGGALPPSPPPSR